MALEKTNTVDVIVKSPHIDGYDLIIVDDGKIRDEIERHNLLIDKLTSYANFVLDGQLYEQHPDAKGKSIRFCVVCQTQPNEAMLKVEGIKPRNEPGVNFPVVIQMQQEYLNGNDPSNGAKKVEKRKWWQLW